MTILHLVKTAVGGRWALGQMRELARLGLRVHVAMPPGPLVEPYREAGVTVHLANFDLPVRAPWRLQALSRQLIELVDRIRPALIHSHFVGTTLTMRVALGRHHHVPRVFQVPGPLHLEHRFYRTMELASAGPADYWVGSCEWTCREYRKAGIASERIFFSYYGTDLERLREDNNSRTPAFSHLRLGSKTVGLVAYMYPPKLHLGQRRGIKGHEDLIDALRICRREVPELLGVFVGGAWNNAHRYRNRVVAYGTRSDPARNIFLDTRHDIKELYAAFDVAVCPSHSENVGAAVESLLCGVPTIATNVGGLPDLVRHGQTGWLVPPRDPAALASAVLDAVRNADKAKRLARNGQKLVRELFDVKKTAAQVASIYEDILSGRSILANRERASPATSDAA